MSPSSRDLSLRIIGALGIDPSSYERFVAWALCEHLAAVIAGDCEITPEFFARPDALKAFRRILLRRFGRHFVQADYEALFERCRVETRQHERRTIAYEDYLKLLWQVPLQCVKCGRAPPDVQLHIDHIIPASRGGSSKRANLQFLCAEDNLRKGNQREAGDAWLSLR
jgi:hypothetical protein